LPNARNGQELEELMRRLTKGSDTSGLVWVPAGTQLRETGWDHTKNIGAIMVSSPPATTRKSSRSRRRKSKSRAIDD